MFLDELVGVTYGLDGFGGVIGDFNIELFFKRHDQLDDVQAVGAQVVDKAGILLNFLFIDIKMLDDDFLYAGFNILAHIVILICLYPINPELLTTSGVISHTLFRILSPRSSPKIWRFPGP